MAKKGELWQEYDKAGRPIGQGLPHEDFGDNSARICGTAHVWLYRDAPTGREILFQKRSMTVDKNPGKWDISAAGHIDGGESPQEAAVRECEEEIGVKISQNDLEYVMTLHNQHHFVIHNVFMCKYSGADAFHFDDGEVDEVKWVPLNEALDFVRSFVKLSLANRTGYWEALLESIAQA